MTTFNGFEVVVHQVDEFGMAIVNKGSEKNFRTFKVRANLIEGLVIA